MVERGLVSNYCWGFELTFDHRCNFELLRPSGYPNLVVWSEIQLEI